MAGDPWVVLVGLVGAAYGWVLAGRLQTLAYRTAAETGPGPGLPRWVLALGHGLLWALLTWRLLPSGRSDPPIGAGPPEVLVALVGLAPFLHFASVGVVLAWIDVDVHRLPRAVTRPAGPVLVVLLTLAAAVSGDWAAWRRALGAGVLLWVFYVAVAALARRLGSRFGRGDVTLSGLLGLLTGHLSWVAPVIATYAAFLLGAGWGLLRVVAARRSLREAIPFGPWMLLGGLVAVLVGAP